MLDEGAPNIVPLHPPFCTVILTPKAEESSDIVPSIVIPATERESPIS